MKVDEDRPPAPRPKKTIMNEKLKRGETLSGQLIVEVTRDKERVYRKVESESEEASSSGRFHITEIRTTRRDPLEQFAQRYVHGMRMPTNHNMIRI